MGLILKQIERFGSCTFPNFSDLTNADKLEFFLPFANSYMNDKYVVHFYERYVQNEQNGNYFCNLQIW